MELIKLIKKFLYNFRKKHLITIIIILFMLLMILFNFSNVFAIENQPSLVGYCNTKIYTDLNDNILNGQYVNFYFYDFYLQCYRVLNITSSEDFSKSLGFYDNIYSGSDVLSNFNVWWNSRVTFTLYDVYFNGDTTTKNIINSVTNSNNNINSIFNINCLNQFTFLYVIHGSGTWEQYEKLDSWNSLYGKELPELPYNSWNGNNILIDNKLVINPGDTTYTADLQLPFIVEVQDDNYNIIARWLCDKSSTYYNAETNTYDFSKENLDFYLFNDTQYNFYLELYTNDDFYYKEDLFSTIWSSNPTSPDAPNPNPDDGDNTENSSKDYTNELDNINDSLQDTNDFLKDENVDDSDFQLPTFEVDDPSSNFFDTIFTGVYNAVTIEDDVIINVDVMNTHIKISSADFNFLVDDRFALIRTILSFSWIFGIGIFILKDIRKILDKIKNGNVDTAVTDDVKADMV